MTLVELLALPLSTPPERSEFTQRVGAYIGEHPDPSPDEAPEALLVKIRECVRLGRV